jgi:hypothetical protein
MELLISLRAGIQQAPEGAIIVKLMPPPSDLERLRDILIGSIGLSGALAILGVILGLVSGGLLFWIRYRRSA